MGMDRTNLASIWSRTLALFLDVLVLILPMGAANSAIPILGPLIVTFLYYPIFHASPTRATIGKRAMGIQVTDGKGNTLTLGMAFLRHVFFCGATPMMFLDPLVALFTANRQSIHDLVADSLVVKGSNNEVAPVDAWLQTIRRLFGGIPN